MLLEGQGLFDVGGGKKSWVQGRVVAVNPLPMFMARRVAVFTMQRHTIAGRPRVSPRELFHASRHQAGQLAYRCDV